MYSDPGPQFWINMTNGLQAIREYRLLDYHVMRVQSTHCEQKRWEDVLASVPDEFLFHMALGYRCYVFDYGAHRELSRAQWQGFEWVRYVLWRRWASRVITPVGRAKCMGPYFAQQYARLSRRAKSRLDYFKPMILGEPKGLIINVAGRTANDGKKEWLFNCIRGEN